MADDTHCEIVVDLSDGRLRADKYQSHAALPEGDGAIRIRVWTTMHCHVPRLPPIDDEKRGHRGLPHGIGCRPVLRPGGRWQGQTLRPYGTGERGQQQEGDSHFFGRPGGLTLMPARRMARVTAEGNRPYFFAAARAVRPRATHLRASFTSLDWRAPMSRSIAH